MNEAAQPEWHWLPHSPMQFFGLEKGFGIEQLKRAYGVLVRRFKPDKFPEEFQRIRAAYEQLERNLRFGLSDSSWDSFSSTQLKIAPELSLDEVPESHNRVDGPRDTDENSVNHGLPSGRSPKLSSKDYVLQQLTQTNPDRIFDSFRAKTNKSADDYYLLAVLADVVEDDSSSFATWLVDGLKRFPREPLLSNLLAEYFKTARLSSDESHEVLVQIASSIPKDAFFFFTEPLWQSYLRQSDWETVHTTLKTCERLIGEVHAHSKTVFYIGLIRWAMWKAPLDWLDSTCRWIEQDSGGLYGAVEMDYEVYASLLSMRKAEQVIRNRGSFGALIIDTARCFCEQEESVSMVAMWNCQTNIASHRFEFLEAFPYEHNVAPEVYRGWVWVSQRMMSRLGYDVIPAEELYLVEDAVFHSLLEINKTFPRRFYYWLTFRQASLLAVYIIISFVFMFIVTVTTQIAGMAILGLNSNWALFFPFLSIGLSVAGAIRLYFLWPKRLHKKMDQRYFERHIKTQYQHVWRIKLARMFAANHFPFEIVTRIVPAVIFHRRRFFRFAAWLPSLMPHDAGLMLYSLAVRFIR